jgi:regulator of sigma E protease
MIIPAILIHLLGRLFPSLITKRKLSDLRSDYKWRQPFFELSGFAFDLVLALIIVSITILTNKVEYLPTENAIYGIEFSDEFEDLGFEDGDIILTINGLEVEKFNELLNTIVVTPGDITIDVRRGESKMEISVTEDEKVELIKNRETTHISPISPTSVRDNKESQGLITELESQGIKDVFITYSQIFKQIGLILTPNPAMEEMGFIVPTGASTVRGWFFLFAIQLVLIGLINLLPLPGLDLGNSIIAAVDNLRKEKFNLKKLQIFRVVSLIIIGVLLLIQVIL